MTPERWRAVEQLYHTAAAEPDADRRAALLTEACGDDAALRREVESLLEYGRKATDFIETPATAVHPALAALVATERERLEISAPGRFVGRSFGAYRVVALIAVGGMGEIYRGVDTRLNRPVAIKTLPPHLSRDAERRERFKREAEAVSRLNHPHICTLYDVGVEDDTPYLVMEYIEGETLERRLTRGALPVPDALEYAVQILEALDSAHRQGIVHRDLKPSNIMLARSGVKVLDFGLALQMPAIAVGFEGGGTPIAHGLTAKGVILGTPQYLSPEQVEGRPADARTDVFAFGTVVYEMITGRRAFVAESAAGLISAILKDDPQPIEQQVPGISRLLRQTLARCLTKDPNERWQTASDLAFHLRGIASPLAAIDEEPSQVARASRWIERAVWLVVIAAAVVGTWLWAAHRSTSPTSAAMPASPAVRLTLSPPPGTVFWSGADVPMAISPDGQLIVYLAADAEGTRRLWLRSLTSERERPLPGTEGASTPFWSPDSQWVGFFARNSLQKIRISSGLAQIVANHVSTYGGAAWSAQDVIVFPATTGGLSRVSAQGGEVSTVTAGEGSHFWPQFLPDGEHFVYTAALPAARIAIGSFRQEPHRTLMTFPVRVSALAYASGHVIYVQDGTLFARPFDERTLSFSGEAGRVLDGIPVSANGRAPFAVSSTGVLAYWPYALETPALLQWFDRDGLSSPAIDVPARYVGFAISPDGRQLVFSRIDESGGADLWLRDLDRQTEGQLTFDRAGYTPQWSPDGRRVLFSGPGQRPPPKLFVRGIADAAPVSRVGADTAMPDFASSWSDDGTSIVSVRIDPRNGNDLWMYHLGTATDTRLSINTEFNESHGRLSPNGQWLAYVTDQSGGNEVWLARFPAGENRRQVSIAGGTSPQWAVDGHELFYISAEKQLMSTPIGIRQTSLEVGTPRALFPLRNLIDEGRLLVPTANNYVVMPDGRRFLAAVIAWDSGAPPYRIVVNWPAMVTR